MPNRYYAPGPQRAARVLELFDTIAPRYDRINDLQSFGLHRIWKARLIRLADPRAEDSALDLCSGTGDLAIAFAKHTRLSVGLDFSPNMLIVARKRASAVASVQFVLGDALSIPFADASFSIVSLSYGLRNLASFEDGLTEAARVTRPGGRILILDFGKPENRVWRGIYLSYLKRFVPVYGRLFCGNADTYRYIAASLDQYPAQSGTARLMESVGLERVRTVNLLGGVMSITIGFREGPKQNPPPG